MLNPATEKTLSVLSLNCWGLLIVAKQRKFRLNAIANHLSQQSYDIVALQEVWMWEDYEILRREVQDSLPYTKYFHSGTLGSGLVILSKFPILSSSYIEFTLAGRPLKVLEGDYFVGKGAGICCIDHPDIGLIDIYTTHASLQAGYGNNDEYEAHRITECWQIANSIRASAAQGRHVILTGDFNSIPTSNCYQILEKHGFMTDSWLEMHQSTIEDSKLRFKQNQLSASDCIQRFGITCDSPLDTWSNHYFKQEAYQKDIGDRLDYIFYRRSPGITCQSSRVTMEQYIPGTQWSYSDHFGVHSIFRIGEQVNKAIGNYSPAAIKLARPDFTRLTPDMLHGLIELLQLNMIKAKKTANGHLALLGLSAVLVFALYAAQIVLPVTFDNDVRTIVLSSVVCGFFMIVCTGVAIVCLIVGFVFGRKEQRSLMQYIADLQVCLEALRTQMKQVVTSNEALLISKNITANNISNSSSITSSTTSTNGFII